MLKPCIKTDPVDVGPIIFLDFYRCYMVWSVVPAIKELVCEVMHIPGGCTHILQPVDVGFNKPFKSGYCTPFYNWMVNQAILHGKIDCPSREQVAEWILEASQSLTYQTLCNA